MKASLIFAPVADRDFIQRFIRENWFDDDMMIRGRLVHAQEVDPIGAYRQGKLVGLATWFVEKRLATLVTLNSFVEGKGVGSALIDHIIGLARAAGCTTLRLITTNDNVEALAFYQRRGFRLTALWPGALDVIRSDKPGVPLIGRNGIPLRDEIELELDL